MSNEEFNEGFRRRTKAFAVEVIQYCERFRLGVSSSINYANPPRLSGQIFERFAEAGRKMKNIPKSV
jgi:hypothetical protein